MFIVSLILFLAMIVAWVVLPSTVAGLVEENVAEVPAMLPSSKNV